MESRRKDITGLRSGKLTAIEPTEQKRNGATLWRCRCDCGGEILLEPYQITGQKVKSCGCLRRENKLIDLAGQRFGRLTALERLDERSGRSYLWRCRCDCGRETKVRASALTSGNTTSCGCANEDALRARAKDLTGQRFGTLTALRPTEKRRWGSVVWACRCDCGREVEYTRHELADGLVKSCGCGQHPNVPLPLHYIDGTCVEMLEKTELRRNNTSGHTGVQLTKRGWRAEIWFRRRRYYLGTYRELDDAVKARERAKEEIHGAFLDWYYTAFPEERREAPAKRPRPVRLTAAGADAPALCP